MREARLQWATVNGTMCHVSRFAQLPPQQRPLALCPLCGQPIIMKLGDERIHHVAHYPNEVCPEFHPETILHLNSKYHLAEQLKKTERLLIEQYCAADWCASKRSVVFISGWNRVEVEYLFGPYRLDVALLKDNALQCAVEVLVTHDVGEEKRNYLSGMEAPD